MAGPLARMYATLGMDASDWDKTMQKVQSDTTRFGGKTQMALRAGMGAIGAGMAFAAKGALDMENRQAAFQAETGASAEEAAHFGDVVNKMAGSTLVSMDDIAMSATKIRTDLGLMGAEADAQLASFVQFERATRQGSDAVIAFDDILDAWNLTADQTAGVMDVLIKSHQQYGGSIADNQRMLAQLAPALQAANFSWEEGQGLLNLFARAGVGAEAAQTAFNRAIGKVESPEELRRLLEDISATEDPFLRAQKAADLFGARAGTKLAQALSDAEGDLGRFTVSVGEAAGATEKAADALDNTITAKFQLAINGASSLLRGFGQDVGPILMGSMAAVNLAGALLPPGALAGAWAKAAAGSSGAIAAAGAAAGKIYALAVQGATAISGALSALWLRMGSPGSSVFGAVEKAGMSAGGRFLIGLGKGITGAGFVLLIGDIVKQVLAQFGVEFGAAVTPIGPDAMRGWFESRGIATEAGQAAGVAMGEGVEQGVATWKGRVWDPIKREFSQPIDMPKMAMSDQMAKIHPSMFKTGIVPAIEEEFDDAAQQVRIGFGNIKQALANPPQMISRTDRLLNMDKKMKSVVRNIRKSIDAGDPWSEGYWRRAQTSLTNRMAALGGSNVKQTGRIKGAHAKSGRAVEGTWRKAATAEGREATRGANIAIAQAQRVKSTIDAIDMVSSGRAMMMELAAGIIGGIPSVSAAASAAGSAAAMAARAAYAAGGGNTFQIGTLIADNKGVDTLQRRMDSRSGARSRGPMRYRQID